jgi:hypothetical protein
MNQDKIDELLALRVTAHEYGGKITTLIQENESLKHDLENTQILLNICLDTLKRNGIGLRK